VGQEEKFWSKVKAETLHSIFSSNSHRITREIKDHELKVVAQILPNIKRVIWLGIGNGEVAKELLRDFPEIELVGVEINESAARFAEYTLKQFLKAPVRIYHMNLKDYEYKPKEKDLILLDFGTYGNLEKETRQHLYKFIEKNLKADGTTVLTVFNPEFKKDHLERYRWDISLGAVDYIKEIRETEKGTRYVFDKGGEEVFSYHPTEKHMLNKLIEKGIEEKYTKILKFPYVNIIVISKEKHKIEL